MGDENESNSTSETMAGAWPYETDAEIRAWQEQCRAKDKIDWAAKAKREEEHRHWLERREAERVALEAARLSFVADLKSAGLTDEWISRCLSACEYHGGGGGGQPRSWHVTNPGTAQEWAAWARKTELSELRESCLRAGAPPKHLNIVLTRREGTPAITAVKKWLASPRTLLYLAGVRGPGKTVAAVYAIAKFGGVFTDMTELGAALAPGNDKGRKRLERACLLVIDDLGTEYTNDWLATAVNNLIVRRDNHELRTIITTNVTFEDFAKRYPRLADRWDESGSKVELAGPSLRASHRAVAPAVDEDGVPAVRDDAVEGLP